MDEKVVAGLRARINLMAYHIFRKLGLGELKATIMTLPLAHRSTRHPRGIIEYVLVKVDKFTFPIDFILLDVDEKVDVPRVLG